MGMLDFLKFQPLVNQKEVIANKKKLTPQEQALLTFGGGQAVGFDQPQNPVSLFPSANAAPGTPNKSVTTGPAQPQGGFDLGGMLGGIAGGIGNALKDPALLSMAVGTGLGLASGQLSPIQSLGAGAQGAQGILNQQREDELALRNKMWQMQLAKAQGGQQPSVDDLIKQGQALGYKGDDLTNYTQGILSQKQTGKVFTGTRAGGFLWREQVPTFQ
jgi:hypothetical protein